MKDIKLTKSDNRKLQSCFNNASSDSIYYPIFDDKINAKLFNHYGLTTNENTHKTASFTFWFNWKSQMWYVGA